MSKLWYEQPAAEWEEALPVGNGSLGAMVYGGIDRELIQVNEESMWFGGAVNRVNPDMKQNLPLIRQYLEQGEIGKAQQLMDTAMSGCPDSEHPYQTLGEIQIFFDHFQSVKYKKSGKIGKIEKMEQIENYQRSLDLEQAICETKYCCEQTTYKREVFASHPAQCIIMQFRAEGEDTINSTIRLRRGKWFDGVEKAGNQGIRLYGNLGRGGVEFAMELRAKTESGRVTTVGECLKIEQARDVTLYFTADTTYHAARDEKETWVREYLKTHQVLPEGLTEELSELEKQEFLYQRALQALLAEKMAKRFAKVMDTPYEVLRKEHVQDYRSLYERFTFELAGSQAYDKVPTDKRLEQAKQGKTDVGLSKMLFDFGRYLTIAGSREGGLPTTLQGIWNKDFFPAWDSKYTININTEMNYWHVESCNLSECHLPLFDLLRKMQKNGRYTARKMYGCRGFVAHHNTDIHGDTAPQDIWYPGSYWTMGAAWLCTHLWQHYLYTQDKKFLQEAFPVMAEAALFFVDFLIEKDGYLVTSPSVSPENSYILPNGEKGACCIGATMDNQILRDLFGGCLGAWKALGEKVPENCCLEGVDDFSAFMTQLAVCNDKLMPDRISESGRIMEWMEDYEEAEPGHRHISHLYGLYPAGQITVDGTPELAEAARKTLAHRLANGGGHTGWSRAWIMNHYASLWDGEEAYQNIEKMLGVSTYANLFDRHPPFQIDGNFGACAAMNRMLVQSSEQRVVLLPALPKAWDTGSVKGLRLIGNAEIAVSWEKGKLVKAEIRADSDYETSVLYENKRKQIQIKAGERKVIVF